MGLVNFWAIPHLSLLSPLLCSSSSWLLLFITGGVASEAASKEVGSKSHPYSTFLRKASQNKKDLGHFYLFHCSPGQSLWAGGQGTGTLWDLPQPAAMCCALASPDPLHQPQATEPWALLMPSRALVPLIWSTGCVTIPTPHPLSPRKWEVEPPG